MTTSTLPVVEVHPRDVLAGEVSIACPHCDRLFLATLPTLKASLLRNQTASLALDVALTPTERLLFECLHAAKGKWLPIAAIQDAVFGRYIGPGSLKSHVCLARQKLRGTGWRIENRIGLYRLVREQVVPAQAPRNGTVMDPRVLTFLTLFLGVPLWIAGPLASAWGM